MAIQSKKSPLPARAPHPPVPRTSRLIHALFWLTAAASVIVLAFLIATRPKDTLFWSAVAILTYLLIRHERLAVYVFIFLPVIGEMFRLPWGPENGLLLSDLFIPLFIGIWVVKKIIQKDHEARTATPKFPETTALKPFLIFCVIAAASLLQAFLFLKPAEILTSSFYLIRLATYTLLFLVVLNNIKDEINAKRLIIATTASALAVAIAGGVQLIIYPDLGKLEEYGWDPHINRLVSTWLDPNFVGGLLAIIICILLGLIFYTRSLRARIAIGTSTIFLTAALFLTYSRSAYLALSAGIIVIGLLKSRKLLIACVIIAALTIAVLPRAEQRLTDLSATISSFIFNTSENPDATARLRIKSWEQTMELIAKRPILGSGYNTLKYVKYNEGFVTDPAIHSASGSDSSLLTILATTGVAGFIPFLIFYLTLLKTAWQNFRNKKSTPFNNGYSLGFLAALIAILTHSLFVNSLLFPQILIFLAVQIGTLVWIERTRIRPV